jgi:hypothetical protein
MFKFFKRTPVQADEHVARYRYYRQYMAQLAYALS